MPTIRQVAKACGVSPMTVSFVLNNKQGQVSEETRERVLKAVREIGYRPAASRWVPDTRKIATLGLVAGVSGDSLMMPGYYSSIVNGILHGADEQGHNLTIFTNSLLHADPHRSIRVYCDGRCDGLLVIAPRPHNPLVAAIRERGLPFVQIGDTGDDEGISFVDIDNPLEARKAVNHLLEQGHMRIAYVGGPEFVRSARQRQQGYRQALEAAGIAPDPRLELSDNVYESLLRVRLQDTMLLPVRERPTAFFAWNDEAAMTIYHVLQEMGLRIPKDVSVVGIDGDPAFTPAPPPLTTLRQPYRTIGTRAVEILVGHIQKTIPCPQREFYLTEWVWGGSVAPPSA